MVMIVCTDNVISHDETGDGPKSPFALITPTGCNPLIGQRLYDTPHQHYRHTLSLITFCPTLTSTPTRIHEYNLSLPVLCYPPLI